MTREIKFRAWNKKNSKMVYQTQYAFLFTKNGITVDKYNSYNDYDGLMAIDEPTIMQFTGLLDKNGKEIYEGDIVKDWQHGGNSKVEWIRTSWQLVSPRNRWGAYCSRLNVLEVIGNIYENPELLK